MSTGKILVVDDDLQIRRVLRIMLTGQGYEIDDATCGEAALEKLRKRRFDLVLLVSRSARSHDSGETGKRYQ